MFCKKCQSFWNGVTSQVQFDTSTVKWSEYSATIHNDFGSLMRSSDQGCPPCRAIVHAVAREGRPDVPVDITVVFELDPQDGTDPVLRGELRTPQGRVIIRKFIIAAFSAYAQDNELPSALSKCQTLENQSTGSDSAIELARFWVNQCLTKHPKCGPSSSSTYFMPTRLLDVANGGIRLIATNEVDISDRRYLALSHCGGKTQNITTTKATLNERQRGIRMSDLSKTFQDSVHVTRKLGFRYLWVDSLCIVQDDPSDREYQSVQVWQVFSHSTLTIAAAHASDGLGGCFVQRDGLLHLPLSLKLRNDMTALFTLYDLTKSIPQLHERSRKSGAEPGSPLFERVWTFQEQFFSRRMLIFNGSEMSWECLCEHGTERSPIEHDSPDLGFHKKIRRRVREEGEFFKDNDFSHRVQHWDWCNAVTDYSCRAMPVATDRSLAISAVADAIQKKTSNTYLAGLWKSELYLGLLWSIPQTWEHPLTASSATDYRTQSLRKLEYNVAPTWSWISVNGPVEYPTAIMDSSLLRICEFGYVDARGSPASKTGIMEIRGHTRTAYINSIYPQAFTKDPECPADMAVSCPDFRTQGFQFKGRRFHPNAYFIFSDERPTDLNKAKWELMRGMWRPDEVVPPDTPITFVAVAQQNHDSGSSTQDRATDPLQVFTIGLVPSSKSSDTYRRVGYAVWDDCAWYGYNCSSEMRYARSKGDSEPVKRPKADPELAEQSGLRTVVRKILEFVCCWTSESVDEPTEKSLDFIEDAYPSEKGFHNHDFVEGRLPEMFSYHDRVTVRTKTLKVE